MGVPHHVGRSRLGGGVFLLEPLVGFTLVCFCWEMSFHPFGPRPDKECDPNWEDGRLNTRLQRFSMFLLMKAALLQRASSLNHAELLMLPCCCQSIETDKNQARWT